jgi:hypothetical protein
VLFYAASTGGQRFTKHQQIPTEVVPRHSQIAVGPGGTITIAWVEQRILDILLNNPRSSTVTNTAVDHLCSRAAQMLPTADAERP